MHAISAVNGGVAALAQKSISIQTNNVQGRGGSEESSEAVDNAGEEKAEGVTSTGTKGVNINTVV